MRKLALGTLAMLSGLTFALGSSHREAPLIAQDPLADNTDLYAFVSPDDPSTVTLIANYIPMQLPHGGPNYYHFSEDVRYEIHIDNDASVPGDEITYRFTFTRTNGDPTTFFNIRLGAENLNTSYTLGRSTDGGMTFQTIVSDGDTPPYNIGARSIEGGAGLNTSYAQLMRDAIETASTGEQVFAGPVDDPFFVDLGGIFDLGDAPRQNGNPYDGLGQFNVHTLAIRVPIATLLKTVAPATPTTILDPDYVIGVWASASRPSELVYQDGEWGATGTDFVQVSRIGMPLTNEAVIPIGQKDFWNSITPYDEITETTLDEYFFNPELALYMDDDQFGGAVPAFTPLRVQTNSLGSFDFSNGADGLFGLKGNPALAGTALDDAVFGTLLLPGPGQPRSVDLWPAFHTGVPNLAPYQLATGKDGNPLAAGKPFVNNFLPNGGDMLRLNMAVPPTPRGSSDFSSLGLVQAAVLGLTDPRFNGDASIQHIPNMDGFPNGRRLEDDVTRIELQAVSGVVLAAIGLWYDDYDPATSPSPVTQDLLDVLTYSTGVEENDLAFTNAFPYEAGPRSGKGPCGGDEVNFTSAFADLELDISLADTTYEIYNEVPYVITINNKGDQTANNVVVSAGLPAGLVFTSSNVTQGDYNLFFERWTVGSLAPGESARLDLTLFTLVDNQRITNFVEVVGSSTPDFDSDPGNDVGETLDEDDEDSIAISPGRGGGGLGDGTADLSVSLSVDDPTYRIYETVPYTVKIRNDGPDDATNVVVRAGLPAGLVFTSSSVTAGDYNLFFEEWTIPQLASGAEETLVLTLFTLIDDRPVTQFVEVLGVTEMDPDSAPANSTGMTPSEDDEAALVITPATPRPSAVGKNSPFLFAEGVGIAPNISLTPTLAKVGQSVTLTLEGINSSNVKLIIMASDGRLVKQLDASLSSGSLRKDIMLDGFTPGLYVLQVEADGQSLAGQRFVVN